jgi:septal ring factor EnvC (AmiA/AmiB activator)
MENSHTDKPEMPTLEYYRDLNEKKWNQILKLEAENASLKGERDRLTAIRDELQNENGELRLRISDMAMLSDSDDGVTWYNLGYSHGAVSSLNDQIEAENSSLREQLDKANQELSLLMTGGTMAERVKEIVELREQNEKLKLDNENAFNAGRELDIDTWVEGNGFFHNSYIDYKLSIMGAN